MANPFGVPESGYSHVLVDDSGLEFEILQKPYTVLKLAALFEQAISAGSRE